MRQQKYIYLRDVIKGINKARRKGKHEAKNGRTWSKLFGLYGSFFVLQAGLAAEEPGLDLEMWFEFCEKSTKLQFYYLSSSK